MFCQECGFQIPDGATACPNCGVVLSSDAPVSAAEEVNQPKIVEGTLPGQAATLPNQSAQPQYQQDPLNAPVNNAAPQSAQMPPQQGYVPPQQGYVPPQQGQPVAPIQPNLSAMSEDDAYRYQAKQQWYCFLMPILFFLPILNEKKDIPGNKAVANNTLLMLLLGFLVVIIRTITPYSLGFVDTILGFAQLAFNVTMFVTAVTGKAIKLPLDIIK